MEDPGRDMLDCADCTERQRGSRHCPDLGCRDIVRVGGLGDAGAAPHEVPGCVGYWKRDVREYPDAPYAIGDRSPWEIASVTHYAMEQGALGVAWSELPGPLADALLLIGNERSRLEALELRKRARQTASGNGRVERVVSGGG